MRYCRLEQHDPSPCPACSFPRTLGTNGFNTSYYLIHRYLFCSSGMSASHESSFCKVPGLPVQDLQDLSKVTLLGISMSRNILNGGVLGHGIVVHARVRRFRDG